MSPQSRATMYQMETVRRSINEHMTSVGEEIVDTLCVLLQQQHNGDVLNVKVFVLERLSVAAQWMCSLFQREMEKQHTKLHTLQHTAGWYKYTHTHTHTHTHTLKTKLQFNSNELYWHDTF